MTKLSTENSKLGFDTYVVTIFYFGITSGLVMIPYAVYSLFSSGSWVKALISIILGPLLAGLFYGLFAAITYPIYSLAMRVVNGYKIDSRSVGNS